MSGREWEDELEYDLNRDIRHPDWKPQARGAGKTTAIRDRIRRALAEERELRLTDPKAPDTE